jgi:hypothetical protein
MPVKPYMIGKVARNLGHPIGLSRVRHLWEKIKYI